jgi:tetratricopeptide (TPR) repeat protein
VINKDVPSYGATAFNAGLSAERSGKNDEAFKFYEMAAANGYEEANSSARAANVLITAGKNDEAMKYIVAANDKFPGDGKIIVTMADIALKTGQDELAIQSLNQAIIKDPSNGVYHWAVGTVYQKTGKDEAALASFVKAAELNPKDDRPFYSLGTLYFNKAVDITEQANKLRLGDPKFDEMEAQAKEEFKNAAPFLEKVLELQGDEGNKVLLNNLFTIHRKLGNSEKALDFKKRADALK